MILSIQCFTVFYCCLSGSEISFLDFVETSVYGSTLSKKLVPHFVLSTKRRKSDNEIISSMSTR